MLKKLNLIFFITNFYLFSNNSNIITSAQTQKGKIALRNRVIHLFIKIAGRYKQKKKGQLCKII